MSKKPHCHWILNEGRLPSFNLNFHLAAKRSCTSATLWAGGGQVRWAQSLPCGRNSGQKLENNNNTPFFFKISFTLPDILQSCIFHIHFMEHLIWTLSPLRGFERVLFFNAPLPMLLCHHEHGFVMAAFGIILPCPPPLHLFPLFICTWKADQCFYFISARLQNAIKNGFYAPELPSICVLKCCLLCAFEQKWGHALLSVYGHSLSESCTCTGLKFSDRVSPPSVFCYTHIAIKSSCWLPLNKILELTESGFYIHHTHTHCSKAACCTTTFGKEWEWESRNSELAMKTCQLPHLQ